MSDADFAAAVIDYASQEAYTKCVQSSRRLRAIQEEMGA